MILSGHQRFDYAQKALKLHCASYVLKPIDKTQLCDDKKINRYYSAAIPVWIKFLLSIEQKTLSSRVQVLRRLNASFSRYVKPHHSTAR